MENRAHRGGDMNHPGDAPRDATTTVRRYLSGAQTSGRFTGQRSNDVPLWLRFLFD